MLINGGGANDDLIEHITKVTQLLDLETDEQFGDQHVAKLNGGANGHHDELDDAPQQQAIIDLAAD